MPQTISSAPNSTASTTRVGPGQARASTPAMIEITPKMAGHHQDRPTRVTRSWTSVLPPPGLRNPSRFTSHHHPEKRGFDARGIDQSGPRFSNDHDLPGGRQRQAG